jgi:rhamnogalacturonyl hydrolase YesR
MFNNTIQLQATNAPNTSFTGLLYHGYDYSHVQDWASADRGHSPEVWDRALGWYSMALVDVLALAPPAQTALRATLTAHLAQIARGLVQQADAATGAWWLVLTQPGRAGNYFESSGGSMFVYALLRGVRLGFVADADGTLVAAARRAYAYAAGSWAVPRSNGTMDWNNTVVVGSLQPGNDYAVRGSLADCRRAAAGADCAAVLHQPGGGRQRPQGRRSLCARELRNRDVVTKSVQISIWLHTANCNKHP